MTLARGRRHIVTAALIGVLLAGCAATPADSGSRRRLPGAGRVDRPAPAFQLNHTARRYARAGAAAPAILATDLSSGFQSRRRDRRPG
jgi:hypothetical protein